MLVQWDCLIQENPRRRHPCHHPRLIQIPTQAMRMISKKKLKCSVALVVALIGKKPNASQSLKTLPKLLLLLLLGM